MTAIPPRGACPTLADPMPTGDGLLARLAPRHGTLSPAQLDAIAAAASCFGNGLLEVTVRGSLQIRGLRAETVEGFAAAVAACGVEPEPAPEIRVSPLAGLAIDEPADPRPLADRLREGIADGIDAGALAPKLAIVIDGGGAPDLRCLSADLRLAARAGSDGTIRWQVGIAGDADGATWLGEGTRCHASDAALALLQMLAERGPACRGRDILADLTAPGSIGLQPTRRTPAHAVPDDARSPVGARRLRDGTMALGLAPAFGQVEAGALQRLALAAGDSGIRLSPGRAIFVTGLGEAAAAGLAADAARFGMIADPADPRLRISACAGAPACASAHLATRDLARSIADRHPNLLRRLPLLYLAGCAKQCARPAGRHVAVTGDGAGPGILAGDAAASAADLEALAGLAGSFASS